MKTDKGQFDEVLRRMIAKNPQKTATIKKVRRKKNPHEGPLPADYKLDGEPLAPEQVAEIGKQNGLLQEYEERKSKQKD
jgi:hypothetical protein